MIGILSFSYAGASYAARGLGRLARALKNRRAANALAGLDDRMLADIGITRSDLRDAYAEPLWHDPTDVLVGRAAERRTSRRSVHPLSGDPEPAWLTCKTVTCG
jgi:uncharacterized protein YjiS (DUF1127 family)